jgi:hypothetical protein
VEGTVIVVSVAADDADEVSSSFRLLLGRVVPLTVVTVVRPLLCALVTADNGRRLTATAPFPLLPAAAANATRPLNGVDGRTDDLYTVDNNGLLPPLLLELTPTEAFSSPNTLIVLIKVSPVNSTHHENIHIR